jgi:hypothetical protein
MAYMEQTSNKETMEYIEEPKVFTKKPAKPKEKTKYKVRGWVEDLMETPNKWAIYAKKPKTRQDMMTLYSRLDSYRTRYPQIEWAISREDDYYAICGRYTPQEEVK